MDGSWNHHAKRNMSDIKSWEPYSKKKKSQDLKNQDYLRNSHKQECVGDITTVCTDVSYIKSWKRKWKLGKLRVSDKLWTLIIMYQYWFMNFDKNTILR